MSNRPVRVVLKQISSDDVGQRTLLSTLVAGAPPNPTYQYVCPNCSAVLLSILGALEGGEVFLCMCGTYGEVPYE